jgi:hypothetical protein
MDLPPKKVVVGCSRRFTIIEWWRTRKALEAALVRR